MYREYRINPTPEHKRKINDYNKNIQNLIQMYRKQKWLDACKNIEQQQGRNYWQEIKKLTKYKTTANIPTLTQNGKEYSEDKEKVEVMAQHFSEAFKEKNYPEYDEANYNSTNNWYNEYFNQPNDNIDNTTYEITEEDYMNIVSRGKSTSPGHDNVTKNLIRHLNPKIHRHIAKMYEYCMNNHYFPKEWKSGIMIFY